MPDALLSLNQHRQNTEQKRQQLLTKKVKKAVTDHNLRQVGATPPACNGSRSHQSHDHSSCAISYRCSIVTESLSPAAFKISGSNGIGTLTFQGHVTLLFTWTFDSPYAIFYRCSIETESLSPAIFQIIGFKHVIELTHEHTQSHIPTNTTNRNTSRQRW